MTIVPTNEELIVDARLSPTDIDNVSVGMRAKVRVMSFMARHTLPIDGEVFYVGADVISDPETRQSYYPLRVRVEKESKERALEQVQLQPGMPAEVFVQTGKHTPLRYLADPIMRSFDRAFREESLK